MFWVCLSLNPFFLAFRQNPLTSQSDSFFLPPVRSFRDPEKIVCDEKEEKKVHLHEYYRRVACPQINVVHRQEECVGIQDLSPLISCSKGPRACHKIPQELIPAAQPTVTATQPTVTAAQPTITAAQCTFNELILAAQATVTAAEPTVITTRDNVLEFPLKSAQKVDAHERTYSCTAHSHSPQLQLRSPQSQLHSPQLQLHRAHPRCCRSPPYRSPPSHTASPQNE